MWKGKSIPHAKLVQDGLLFLKQWQEAQWKDKKIVQGPAGDFVAKWSRPPSGWLKCSVDACVFGCIIRYSSGSFVSAKAGSMMCSVLSPSVAGGHLAFRKR